MAKFFGSIGMERLSVFSLFSLCMLSLPGALEASQVNGVSLMDSASGDVLRIETDEPLEYQLFDLDGPPRVVISFPGSALNDGVNAINADGSGVTGVFPAKDADGVRMEIGLSEPLGYKVEESGNTLTIKFSAVEKQANDVSVAATIKDIEVRDRGAMTELILRGDNMDANHNSFLSSDNQTLIVDFWGGSSALPKENYKYATQRIHDVTVGATDGRVRLVIGLLPSDQIKQQIDVSKGELVVRIGDVMTKRKASSLVVEDVTFQPDDRIAHLIIRTDSVNPIVNIKEKDDTVIIDLKKSQLAQGQERSQDVSAFPGPIKQVDSYPLGEDVRIVARLRDEVDVTSFQQGNIFTINLEPQDLRLSKGASGVDGDEFAYSGKKVTFDFKDMDITNALKLISEMSNLNIIMADDVQGKLSMRLVDVPWDQALDIILSSQGLGKELDGNVMRIAPLAVLRQENKEALEGMKDVEMIEPLITQPIQLSYAGVDEIKKMLDESKAKDSTGNTSADTGTSILSSRGSYMIDQRTNTLIVTDTEKALNNVKRFISIIDTPVKQVLIEARIVEASSSFTEEFGIRWGGQYQDTPNIKFPNSINIGQGGGAGLTGTDGFLVDLPAASAAGSGGALGISLGSFAGILNLDLELSAAEVDGDAKIISSPRIVTTNGKAATISQGTDVPFVTPASGSGPATVTFKKAVLQLDVTPQISADNTINLKIDISKDAPTGASVQGNPIISTKKITTNLSVDNGDTVVIGGIFTRDSGANESGVPGLKDIPVLGWLFKTKSNTDNKTELLIFLTPKVQMDTL